MPVHLPSYKKSIPCDNSYSGAVALARLGGGSNGVQSSVTVGGEICKLNHHDYSVEGKGDRIKTRVIMGTLQM